MGQWQPIETAPKDGRCILAWRKHTTRPLVTRWDQIYGEWENDDSGFHVYGITHWMPLPAAPGATAEPAPAREPMTDEQIESGRSSWWVDFGRLSDSAFLAGVRFAERHHGICKE